MPNASAPITKTRARSRIVNSILGWITPEHIIPLANPVAPGAVGQFVFVAPRACKLVRVDQVNEIAGAGSSKIFLRKHVAGQTAAANAAVSTTNIVDLITGGLAADATVRVPVLNTTLVTTTGYTTMATGDKLALVTPATWAGLVALYVVFL